MFPLECGVQYTHIFGQDFVIEDVGFLDSIVNPSPENTKKRQRKSLQNSEENKDEENNERKTRKIMHRDIERQRRQEMNSLYTTLRSLLPIELIKGKRSISDHMHEAVNYIKHMERKLKELKIRRDDLKISNNSSLIASKDIRPNCNIDLQNCVTVSPCLDGVEILVSVGLKGEETFPFSKVVKLLIQTGLNVISCVSTEANGKILYRIKTQDNGQTRVDLSVVHQRLSHVINSFKSF